jgi:hypothetical protein
VGFRADLDEFKMSRSITAMLALTTLGSQNVASVQIQSLPGTDPRFFGRLPRSLNTLQAVFSWWPLYLEN